MRASLLVAALLALAGFARSGAAAPAPVEIDDDEAGAHRLSDHDSVRDVSARDSSGWIRVRLIVGTDGNVVSAQVDIDSRWSQRFPASVEMQASRLARSWRYRPFTRGGRPVAVTFVDAIPLYPPEDRPSVHVEMPSFDRSVRIALARSGCYGACPIYAVEIAADGSVTFNGINDVLVRARHRARIDPIAVRRLYDLARRADFFSLRVAYEASITDIATYTTTIEAGGRRWEIKDYGGEMVGMPSIVRRLEDAIDEAAGTRRWIEGDETIVRRLIAERFEFRSFEGARMLASAAGAGKARMVAQFVAAGAPLRAPPPTGSDERPVAALAAAAQGGNRAILAFLLSRRANWSRAELREALYAAAEEGHYDAVRLLADRGALAGIDRSQANVLLHQAAQSGDTRFVARVLALHPAVNLVETYPNNQVLAEAARVTCPQNRAPPACDPLRVVAMLLRAGANPRIVNPTMPSSPLAFVSDVRTARLLLAAGADPNFADFQGEAPIFFVSDEDVALAMLDAGANPRALRPGDGMSVAAWARYQQWPRVLARLKALRAD